MRIGVLGGTFDPIHHGHLSVAEECRHRLKLDRVLFLPAGDPPHKRGKKITQAKHRVAMVEMAIASNPAFALSRIDVDRPGPSYTIGALDELRARHPDAKLWFLMGGDSLADLLTWHHPERLIELARVAATNRPGAPKPDPKALDPKLPGASKRIDVVDIPWLDISGSGLRQRVARGQPIKYLLPEAVERYVLENDLYRRKR
jgi:nicotinate-nucleotide adenylyltransferase